ncbi:MAG: FAD-dependent oxidoreductase [Proteobacteria bacterium]|nr:FAD-dependent oxidoreductase [Pseudomonadota bacterium]
MTTGITRRNFINLVGHAGGAAAVYATLSAMGLLPVPAAYAGPPALPRGSGRGVRVAVLGAGIAGMTAAYELRKAGYRCTILEARDRGGGRVRTIRGGDTVVETDSTQRVAWDRRPHLYFNPGPARLPHHHQGILSYCREFGVPLEVMVNDNRAALVQDDAAFGGQPQPARRLINDARGFVAELAAKGLAPSALDQPLSAEDLDNLRGSLRGSCGPSAAWARISDIADRRAPAMPSRPAPATRPARSTRRCHSPRSSRREPGALPCSLPKAGTRPRQCCSRSAAWTRSPAPSRAPSVRWLPTTPKLLRSAVSASGRASSGAIAKADTTLRSKPTSSSARFPCRCCSRSMPTSRHR